MNIKEALIKAAEIFRQKDIESKFIDARILLSHTLFKSQEYILAHQNHELNQEEETKFLQFVDRRAKKEPIAYIIETTEFYGLNFSVNKHVLIPRPDTEILVETILKLYKTNYQNSHINILDLGTGSGIIAITLAKEIPQLSAVATDISLDALEIAKINSLHNNTNNQISFIHSNWYENVNHASQFEIIVSNPPYIAISEQGLMSEETILYEPKQALYAEQEGLLNYQIIIKGASSYLKPYGFLVLEIGFRQQKAICSLLENNGFKIISTLQDLSGNDRVVVGQIC